MGALTHSSVHKMEGIRFRFEDADGTHQRQFRVPAFQHVELSGSGFSAISLDLHNKNILGDLLIGDDFALEISHNLIVRWIINGFIFTLRR